MHERKIIENYLILTFALKCKYMQNILLEWEG